jgi:hypothetical protein
LRAPVYAAGRADIPAERVRFQPFPPLGEADPEVVRQRDE